MMTNKPINTPRKIDSIDYKTIIEDAGLFSKIGKHLIPAVNLEFQILLVEELIKEALGNTGINFRGNSYESEKAFDSIYKELTYKVYTALSRSFNIEFTNIPLYLMMYEISNLRKKMASNSMYLSRIIASVLHKEITKAGMDVPKDRIFNEVNSVINKYWALEFTKKIPITEKTSQKVSKIISK